MDQPCRLVTLQWTDTSESESQDALQILRQAGGPQACLTRPFFLLPLTLSRRRCPQLLPHRLPRWALPVDTVPCARQLLWAVSKMRVPLGSPTFTTTATEPNGY